MDYRKVVTLTTELTSTTTLIDDPNDYQVSDVVTRYTKPVYVIGGPPSEPLEVAAGQGANWVGSNVYEVGQTIEAKTASYTGGVEPVTYRCRFQFRPAGGDWENGPWQNTPNEKTSFFFTIDEEGDIKFQTQARDSSEPVVPLASTTGTKTCKGIGDITATVFGNPYDLVAAPALTILTLDPIPVAIQKSGSANVTYSWSVRGAAAAEFSNPIGASTDVTIATAGVATVQCTIQSLGEIKKVDIQFFGVATKEELIELTN